MKEPTKADLAAAVAKLTEENASLRDLLAAVSLAAGTVPVSKDDDAAEWRRSAKVLAVIKNAADLDDSNWDGYLAWAAEELRELAAEPVGYEVYVAFKDAPVITCSERTCDARHPQTGDWCVLEGPCVVHRDTYGQTWAAGQGGVLFNVGDKDEPCSPDAAQVLAAAIAAGTPVVVTDDEPASIVGRIVVDAHDDSPCPVTGKIVGQVDEDTVEVLWGERQFEDHPGTGSYEPMDALRPARQQVTR